MELFETAGNQMPPEAIVSAIRTRDGLNLRVARWAAPRARGTVLVAIGRSEFIEEYYEVVEALLERGFDAIVFDWRGQGQSSREIGSGRRGYVSSFAAYRRDLNAIEAQVLRPLAPRPWFAYGHSMGAAILLDQAHDGLSPFERLVLSAPMIDIRLRFKREIRAGIALADAIGLGRMIVPGGSETSIFLTRKFESNNLTADPRQYDRLFRATSDLPALAIGAPTVHWLNEAFRLMRRFARPNYPVETLMPILMIAAGADRIVDTAAVERFAIRLKAGRCITIPDARHQILMETPAVTSQFWAAFDAFVPGERIIEAQDKKVAAAVVKRRRRVGFA